jgi:glutamate dehydrogenase
VATKPDEAKAAALEATIARVREGSEAAEAEQLERFVRGYYEHVAPEDIVARSDVDLAGAALAHWSLLRARRAGESKVHVYSPTVEEHGWESPHTVIETVTDDVPFLVDSVTMELSAQQRNIHVIVHPQFEVTRDEEGRLLEVGAEDGQSESLIHVEIDRQTDPAVLEQLCVDLQRVLRDVRAAVDDWPAMRQRARTIGREVVERAIPDPRRRPSGRPARLDRGWPLHVPGLPGIRHRDRERRGRPARRARLGPRILREQGDRPVSASFEQLPPNVRKLAREKNLLNVTKANSRAPFTGVVSRLRRCGAPTRRAR